jgi:hypothetical protein
MAQYRVVLTGFQDSSMDGMAHFYTKFGQAYNKTPKEARTWLEQAKNVLYRFDDLEPAEKARVYIESLGGLARVEEAPPEPIFSPLAPQDPPEPAPAPAEPTPVPSWDAGPMFMPAPVYGPPRAAPPGAPPGDWAYQYGGQPVPYRPPVKNYLQYHDLGTIISATFELFFNNFVPLLMVNLIQFAPLAVLAVIGMVFGFAGALGPMMSGKPNPAMFGGMMAVVILIMVVLMPVYLYVSMFCQCASVFAIAEAINGRTPDYRACLKKVDYLMPLRLLVTSLLPGLAAIICMALPAVLLGIGAAKEAPPFLIMGGVLLAFMIPLVIYIGVLVMFMAPIVVLEGVWLMDAVNRSVEISRGYRLRNLVIMSVVFLIVFVPAMMVNCIGNFIPLIGGIVGGLIQVMIAVLLMVPLLLLYYDLRLREQGGADRFGGPATG